MIYKERCRAARVMRSGPSTLFRSPVSTVLRIQYIKMSSVCLSHRSPSPPSLTSKQPAFNSSEPKGGDTLLVDVNAQYVGFEYHYTYIMFCGFIVWLIIPGIGLLYGGLARRKSAVTLLFQSLMVGAVTTFQWMFWGYSLAYSRTASPFIGDLANFGMKNVMAAPSPGSAVLPEIVFCLYQLLFCACTVQIVIGGAFERGRIVPSLIFAFFWATIVYCPIACWTWNANGWLYNVSPKTFSNLALTNECSFLLSILLEAALYISHLDGPHSLTLSSSASAKSQERSRTIDHTIPLSSFSAPS